MSDGNAVTGCLWAIFIEAAIVALIVAGYALAR